MSTDINMTAAYGTILDIPSEGVERRGEISISATTGFFKVDRYDGSNVYSNNFLKQHTLTGSGAKITGNNVSPDNKYIVENAEYLAGVYRFRLHSDNRLYLHESYTRNSIVTDTDSTTYAATIGSDRNLELAEFGPDIQSLAGTTLRSYRISGSKRIRTYSPYSNNKEFTGRYITHIYIEDDNFKGYDSDGYKNSLFQANELILYRDGFAYRDDNNAIVLEQYPNIDKLPSQRWISIEMDIVAGGRQIKSVSNVKVNGISLGDRVFDKQVLDSFWYRPYEYEYDNAESVIRVTDAFIIEDSLITFIDEDGKNEYFELVKLYISPDNNAGADNVDTQLQ